MNLVTNKVVLVGDGTVGKTSLLQTYLSGHFPKEYIPTLSDQTTKTVGRGDTSIILDIWDTAGQEDYARLRSLSYIGTKCIVLCYAVNDRDSFDNIQTKWLPEIRKALKTKPALVLVGTKCELRNGVHNLCVTTEQGHQMMTTIRAAKFIECSAKNNVNVERLFSKVAKVVRNYDDKSCTIV